MPTLLEVGTIEQAYLSTLIHYARIIVGLGAHVQFMWCKILCLKTIQFLFFILKTVVVQSWLETIIKITCISKIIYVI